MEKELVTNSVLYDVVFISVGLLGTSLGIIVIIIVVTQSPESMRTYKRFIINFTMHDMLFALTLGILVKPDPIFPFTGAYIDGLFKFFGERGADFAIVDTAGFAMATQCACIIYRFAVLQSNPRILEFVISWNVWICCYLGAISVSVGIFYLFSHMQPPQSEIPGKIIAASVNFPDAPLPVFEGKLMIYMDYTSQHSKYAGIFVFVGFFLAELVSIGCVFIILGQLEAKKSSFSKATYKLHRQLTIALGVQLSTPFLFIIAPVSYGIVLTYMKRRTNTVLGRLAIMYIDLYGASNSIVTLYFVKPYRMFVILKFKEILKFISCGKYGNVPEIIPVLAPESTVISTLA